MLLFNFLLTNSTYTSVF